MPEICIEFSRGEGKNQLRLTQGNSEIVLEFLEGAGEMPNYWESGGFIRRLANAYDQMQIDAVKAHAEYVAPPVPKKVRKVPGLRKRWSLARAASA